jgi:hypothetical protein
MRGGQSGPPGTRESCAPADLKASRAFVATDGTVTDGPYPEAIGGVTVVEVPSREEALMWAAKTASACRFAVQLWEFGALTGAAGRRAGRTSGRTASRITGTQWSGQYPGHESSECQERGAERQLAPDHDGSLVECQQTRVSDRERPGEAVVCGPFWPEGLRWNCPGMPSRSALGCE